MCASTLVNLFIENMYMKKEQRLNGGQKGSMTTLGIHHDGMVPGEVTAPGQWAAGQGSLSLLLWTSDQRIESGTV